MLVMQGDYFVYEDIIQSARGLGWKVQTIATANSGKAETSFLSTLLGLLVSFKPDFVLTINHMGFDESGVLAGLLEQFGVPLASWFVDHPLPILGGAEANARSNCQAFCFERSALDWLASIGFDEPTYLPTGSNPSRFHPNAIDESLAIKFGRPLALVAGSWWQKAREDHSETVLQLANDMAAKHKVDRSFVRKHLAQYLEVSDKSVGRAPFHAAQAALAEASMRKRQSFVQALAPLNPVIFGDANWEKLISNVQLEAQVDPNLELPAVFAGTQVNLNVTAEQMPTAVNQRVWDVPGSGAFLLTDAQEDVHLHFKEGHDIVTYNSFDEAHDKARFYLANDGERHAIAQRALQTIDTAHRTHHRLSTIEDIMRHRFS
ncbi:MAG: spore maturation protein CgeB [Planctomycetota bacterium]|jgi:spore maturation protein CgeB